MAQEVNKVAHFILFTHTGSIQTMTQLEVPCVVFCNHDLLHHQPSVVVHVLHATAKHHSCGQVLEWSGSQWLPQLPSHIHVDCCGHCESVEE